MSGRFFGTSLMRGARGLADFQDALQGIRNVVTMRPCWGDCLWMESQIFRMCDN